ncbi:MAG: hypothetical protein JNL11_01360 [Bdellovibrionaceae bacterium]|nr:hypothetical protein [Pseudobdellovibrionaceae bacterium]
MEIQNSADRVVTWRALLSVYIVIPLMAFVMAVDFFFLNRQLSRALPADPEDWVAFRLLFVLPHIFVGNFIMADRGYLNHYKPIRYISVILFSLLLYPAFRYTVGVIYFWVLFDIWTIWHGCGQQIGLNRMLVKRNRGFYKIWTVAYFFVILVVYSQMYVSVDFFKMNELRIDELSKSILVGLGLLLFGSSFLFSSSDVKWSHSISMANGSLPAFGCIALYLNYPLFAIIAFRVVHDVTALYIYWVHDVNRNQQASHNWFHKLSSYLPIPATFRMLVIAFSAAAIVSIYQDRNWVVQYVAISFSLFHYIVETFIWRRESLHRQYVPFVS